MITLYFHKESDCVEDLNLTSNKYWNKALWGKPIKSISISKLTKK